MKLFNKPVDPPRLEAIFTGWIAGIFGVALEIGGVFLVCEGFVSSSRSAVPVQDASDAAQYYADAFVAYLFGSGLILFGLVSLAFVWYAFRYAKDCR